MKRTFLGRYFTANREPSVLAVNWSWPLAPNMTGLPPTVRPSDVTATLSLSSTSKYTMGGHVGRVGHHFGSDVASISTSMPISLKSVLTALSIASPRTPL